MSNDATTPIGSSDGAHIAQTSREVAQPHVLQVALRDQPGSSADGMGLLASRASSPGGSVAPVSEAGTHVSAIPPQHFNMAANEMHVTLDNSQHITVNTLNVDAINNIQMQANVTIERMKLEGAQALGSCEAVFAAMNNAHEEERRNWYAVGERVVAECHQQVAAANTVGNEQILRNASGNGS